MLDARFIRDNLDLVVANTRTRGVEADPARVVHLMEQRAVTQQELDGLRAQRNDNARAMKGQMPDEERQQLISAGRQLKEQIPALERKLSDLSEQMQSELLKIPNLTHPDAPIGETDAENREISAWGKPNRGLTEDHVSIMQRLDLIDFETAAEVTGTKFYFLRNQAVLLDLALVRLALDVISRNGFTLCATPDLARESVLQNIGFNPRGPESNVYTIEESDLCLIGTAEITLGGTQAGRIMDVGSLPMKIGGLSHCFRRESGASGRYSKGLYRVHQFTKVEMFAFCLPEDSDTLHLQMLAVEEEIFRLLEVPYRVVDTATGDLGGPAYRKYDIEAWMPGRGDYGEVTSTSNCTDYQARRLDSRFRGSDGKPAFVHTLNGTAIATSRGMIAVLENHVQPDGSVSIPEALQPYTGFTSIPAIG